jgi:hypothetical protein
MRRHNHPALRATISRQTMDWSCVRALCDADVN